MKKTLFLVLALVLTTLFGCKDPSKWYLTGYEMGNSFSSTITRHTPQCVGSRSMQGNRAQMTQQTALGC